MNVEVPLRLNTTMKPCNCSCGCKELGSDGMCFMCQCDSHELKRKRMTRLEMKARRKEDAEHYRDAEDLAAFARGR